MKTVRKHLTVGVLGATLVVAFVGIIGMFMTILDAFRAIDVYRAAGMEPDVGYWVSLYVVPSIIGIIVLLLTFAGCVCYIRFDMFQDTPKRENRVLHMALCATSVFMFTRMIQFFFYNSRGTAGLLGAIFHMTFFLPLVAIGVIIYFLFVLAGFDLPFATFPQPFKYLIINLFSLTLLICVAVILFPVMGREDKAFKIKVRKKK